MRTQPILNKIISEKMALNHSDGVETIGVKHLILLNIKILLMFHLVTLVFMVKAFSQNLDNGLLENNNCFLALKANNEAISQTLCIGDKISVKLRDNDIIRGKISMLSHNYIIIADEYEIDVNKIKWIKKAKLTAGHAIVGGLMTAAGLALFIYVSEGNVDLDAIPLQGGLAIILFTTGIVILTSPRKYHIERGDKLIYKD